MVLLQGSYLRQFCRLKSDQPIRPGLQLPSDAVITVAGKRLTGSTTLRDVGMAEATLCVLQVERQGGLLGGGATGSKPAGKVLQHADLLQLCIFFVSFPVCSTSPPPHFSPSPHLVPSTHVRTHISLLSLPYPFHLFGMLLCVFAPSAGSA